MAWPTGSQAVAQRCGALAGRARGLVHGAQHVHPVTRGALDAAGAAWRGASANTCGDTLVLKPSLKLGISSREASASPGT
jgi:hypothetical protein